MEGLKPATPWDDGLLPSSGTRLEVNGIAQNARNPPNRPTWRQIPKFAGSRFRAELAFSPCGCRKAGAHKSINTLKWESVFKYIFECTNQVFVADLNFEKWRLEDRPTWREPTEPGSEQFLLFWTILWCIPSWIQSIVTVSDHSDTLRADLENSSLPAHRPTWRGHSTFGPGCRNTTWWDQRATVAPPTSTYAAPSHNTRLQTLVDLRPWNNRSLFDTTNNSVFFIL